MDDNGDPVLNEDGSPRFRVETWPIRTSGYVAASFTEFTSRADDPQLHTHVVVANKVKGVDGLWRTIDGRLLYRHQLAAGYLQEAVLRRELTDRLGVRWQPVRNGMANIEGFTRHQMEAFSRRRVQLEAWREEQGLPDTAAARQAAVLATRNPKQDHPLDQLEFEWRLRAVEVGLTPKAIGRMMGRGRQIDAADPDLLAERLASPQGLTEKTSTFGQAEVVKEIAASLPQGGTRKNIEALADDFLSGREVIPVLQISEPAQTSGSLDVADDELTTRPQPLRHRSGGLFPGSPERRFTTTELLRIEQRVLRRALDCIGARRWRSPRRLLERVLGRHPQLTASQREMVRRFATSGDAIEVGVGPAGSGKTAVMAVLRELATFTATPILGAALAARAAVGLQTASGIPSSTLTRLLAEARDDGGLPKGVVMVVDEASMVGSRQLAALSDLVDEAEGKLILIGDDRQLPEIDAGGLFRALARRLPAVELTDNVRQQEPWEREALAQLRDGSVGRAVEMYQQRRRIIVAQCRHETLARAVDDWYRHVAATGDLSDSLLIAHDNDTVADLNQRARIHLAASRRLEGPALEVGERVFQAGDRILCLQNQSRLGVLNGDLGTLLAVDPDGQSLTVRLDRDPDTRQLPAWYLDQGHIDYGYALTGHKAQGITTGRTFTV
ncbi:MAG: MobF family relaxase, partial [Acidimicrobiia bacterium]